MTLIVSYAIVLMCGIGIAISGMGNPAKVLNVFEVAGMRDPSLMLVTGARSW